MQVSAHVSLLLHPHMELTDCSSRPVNDERDGVLPPLNTSSTTSPCLVCSCRILWTCTTKGHKNHITDM